MKKLIIKFKSLDYWTKHIIISLSIGIAIVILSQIFLR